MFSFIFRSTPCPNVKHGDEWGEPSNCENGDNCGYCHTRTEQQFHPEIYKSTKCNDVQTAGYCPRGVFCAFAHIDRMFCFLFLHFKKEISIEYTCELLVEKEYQLLISYTRSLNRELSQIPIRHIEQGS